MDVTLVVDPGRSRVTMQADATSWSGDPVMTWTPAAAWIGPEGQVRVGNAAQIAARRAPEHRLLGWVDGLLRDEPLDLPEAPGVDAAQLFGRLLHDPVRVSVLGLGARPQEVRSVVVGLVVPDGATEAGVARTASAVRATVQEVCPDAAVEVRAVGEGEAVREAAGPEPTGSMLALEVGAGAALARVLGPGEDTVVTDPTLGSTAWDTQLDQHLRSLLDPDTAAGDGATTVTGAALDRARQGVLTPGGEDVELGPGLGRVRVTDLEGALAPQVRGLLDLGRRALSGAGVSPARVLLLGGFAASLPVAHAAADAFGVPVTRRPDAGGETVRGARAALAGVPALALAAAPAAATPVDTADEGDEDADLAWWSSEPAGATAVARGSSGVGRRGLAAALALAVVLASAVLASWLGLFDRSPRVAAPSPTGIGQTSDDVAASATPPAVPATSDSAATTAAPTSEDPATSSSADRTSSTSSTTDGGAVASASPSAGTSAAAASRTSVTPAPAGAAATTPRRTTTAPSSPRPAPTSSTRPWTPAPPSSTWTPAPSPRPTSTWTPRPTTPPAPTTPAPTTPVPTTPVPTGPAPTTPVPTQPTTTPPPVPAPTSGKPGNPKPTKPGNSGKPTATATLAP